MKGNPRCQGCGQPKNDQKKYCAKCKAKLAEMRESGYLQNTMGKYAATTFNDERGRKNPGLWRLGSATKEDRYDEESEP